MVMRTLAAVAALLISACGARAASPEELKAICEEAAKRYEEQFGSAQELRRSPWWPCSNTRSVRAILLSNGGRW